MKARQLPLPVEPGALVARLPFDTVSFEIETAGLSAPAVQAYMRFLTWSWLRGALPVTAAGRRDVARQTPPVFAAAWRELAPLCSRRRVGYVVRWLEQQRAAVITKAHHKSEQAAGAGRASGQKRRGSMTPPPARGKLIRPDRFHRPPATFKVLAAFCTKELFNAWDALELDTRPTLEDFKAKAGKYFDWSDDVDLPRRAFEASEAEWTRRHAIARGRIERHARETGGRFR